MNSKTKDDHILETGSSRVEKTAYGWHADGGNLYLLVRGTSRSWFFRHLSDRQERRNMGLSSL